jgi:hypothetical protein
LTAYLAGDVSACCIKNKLVTAVTTAGLLAGLFGSAFVPAARAAAGVVDATNSTFSETELEGSGTSALPYELYAPSMADPAEADATITFTLRDSAGNTINTTNVDITTSGVVSVCDGAVKSTNTGQTSNVGVIIVEACADSTTSTGTGTISVSAGGGSETVYFKVFGPPSSAVLANDGMAYQAVGIAGATNQILITVKDSSGFDLADNATAFTDAVADADVTFTLTARSVGAAANVSTQTAAAAAGAVNDGKWSLLLAACDAGEETDVFEFYATVAGVAGQASPASNTITITCTEAEAATITNISLLNSSVLPSGAQRIRYTLEDAYGQPCGYGCALDVSDHTIAITTSPFDEGAFTEVAAAAVADLTVGAHSSDVAGIASVALTASGNNPGVKAVMFAVTDMDQATAGNQAGSYTLTYRVTDPASGTATNGTVSILAGAKLKKATITLSAAAGKLVTVTIEKVTTGRTFTYYRKANASGVATFKIRRTGTWEVFAAYGDDVTDTVTLKK